MATKNTQIDRLLTAIGITIIVLLSACSSQDPEPVVVQPPPVDPRFASADGLLETFNQIITQPRVDPYAVMDLFYAENDLQRRLLALMRDGISFQNLEQTVFEKFGEHLSPDRKSPPFAPDKPSRIIESDGQRVTAEGIDADGKKYKTYFVQIGERWWVSGYTMEYDPEVKQGLDNLEALERTVALVAAASPQVLKNIEDGAIRSIGEARLAFQLEVSMRPP